MNDITIKIIVATYSALILPILGYIVRTIKKIRDDKIHGHDKLDSFIVEMREANQEQRAEIKDLRRTVEESEMRASRYRIIRFDDEYCKTGLKASDDHVDQILEDIDIYSAYCQHHPEFKNHKGAGSMNRILTADQNGTLRGGSSNAF